MLDLTLKQRNLVGLQCTDSMPQTWSSGAYTEIN